jgi:hypothetical protein
MSVAEKDAARAALSRFRERVGAGDRAELLAAGAEKNAAATRRRAELVDWAVEEAGIARAHAMTIYDTAEEEGLVPAFAFELVLSRVAVCRGPRLDAPVPPADTSVEGAPEWITPAEVVEPRATESLVREWRMRTSFRRLRGHLERCGSPEEAIDAFCAEPDVGECGYLID